MEKNEGLMTIVVVALVIFALMSVAMPVVAAAEYECPRDVQQAEQQYMAAYNRLASLMAEGKGDTPEGQVAYQEFAKAMACYKSRLSDDYYGTRGFARIKDWDKSGDSFSFSRGEVCSGCWHDAPDSDFFIADRAEDSIIHVSDSPGIIDMGNIPLDDIKEAPASGYVEMATPIMGHSYVVRSKGKYGKFYLEETYEKDPTEYGIRWVYQLNGTRAFGGAEAPGEPATPGQTGTGREYECPQDAGEAYQWYIAAYNKLTYLMAHGGGDTPGAQAAYEEYKAAKACYESRTSGFATFATIEDWDESGDSFSFSRGKVVSEGGDFFIADRGENSIIHVFDSHGIIDMGDIPLGDIKEAPESGYQNFAKPIEGHSYVMWSHGKYGKIRIEDIFSPEDYDGISVTKYEFEWVYQPDGTRSFGGGEAPTPTPTPSGSGTSYLEGTLTHSGFDFSEGTTGESPIRDGEVIYWQPGAATHPDYPRGEYLWWRNTRLDDVNHASQTKDMGAVDIATVREVPAEWDKSPLIPPLLVGHTIVAKCYDGYVKFQVISVGPTDASARVKYLYSTDTTFAEGTPTPTPIDGEDTQWAYDATASSEYSSTGWSAKQATGAPNTAACGDIRTAWAPKSSGSDPEWLKLTFDTPVHATKLRVHETYNAGFIYRVDLVDINGGTHTIWEGSDTTSCPGWFEITFSQTTYLVRGVILHTRINGWEEIDAVQLVAGAEEVTPMPSPTPVGHKLVAYYPFNGDTQDHSGNGNHGTNHGATFVSGVSGKALSFDGKDDYISTDYTQNSVTAYTIEVWVKTTDSGNKKTFVQDRGSGAGKSLTLGMGRSGGGFGSSGQVFYILDSDDIDIGVHSVQTINDNNWHHVVGVWSASPETEIDPSQFKIYIDGVPVTTTSGNYGSSSHPKSPLTGLGGTKIARDAGNTNFNGIIDEVRIYNYALTASEIKANYNNIKDTPTTCNALGDISYADEVVGFWPGKGTGSPYDNSQNTIGPRDKTHASLGQGGILTVRFTDNYLMDVDGPDLCVFEVGPAIESFKVEISKDGSNWIDLGTVKGQPSSIDIHNKVAPGDKFSYVKITDLKSHTGNPPAEGADIDAVGAIGAAPTSTPSPTPATPGQTGTGGEYECPQDAGEALQWYIAAYNKLTSLIAKCEGDLDSPATLQAYEEYKAAKACYESRISGTETPPTPTPTPSEPATPGQTVTGGEYECPQDYRQAYQWYIAAYNRLASLITKCEGDLDSPAALQAYEEYKAAKACYESGASGTEPSPTPTPTQTPTPSGSGTSYPEATLTHSGFDFSEGTTGESPIRDGEVIYWQPGGGTHPSYPRDSGYLWWRNTRLDDVNHASQTKDMGAVDIATVREVPAEWDKSPLIPPLLMGHTIVAKCYDGYVKFQVMSVDSADESARVKYLYSPDTTFDEGTPTLQPTP